MQSLSAIASLARDQTMRQHAAMATVLGAMTGLVVMTLMMPPAGLLAAAPAGTPAALLVPLALSL